MNVRLVQGIYVLLGSNLGDRRDNLQRALHHIGTKAGRILRTSAVYESQPWGEPDQPDFYNQVVEIDTPLPAEALLFALQAIEKAMGKHKLGKWRERLIDLDLLYYRNRIVRTGRLTVPHPEIQHRNFTLLPLCELVPDEMHPLLRLTHRQLLAASRDTLEVRVLPS